VYFVWSTAAELRKKRSREQCEAEDRQPAPDARGH
jgi:hypothetical protein